MDILLRINNMIHKCDNPKIKYDRVLCPNCEVRMLTSNLNAPENYLSFYCSRCFSHYYVKNRKIVKAIYKLDYPDYDKKDTVINGANIIMVE